MPKKPKKGPEKKFFSTFTMRMTAEDLNLYKRAADATPERLSMSQWARGVLTRAALKLLGE